MKLLIVTPAYAPTLGGAERLVREIATRLVRRGHAVQVLTTDVRHSWDLWHGRPAGLPKDEIRDGVRVRRLPANGGLAGRLLDVWDRIPGGYRVGAGLFGPDGFDLLRRQPRPALMRALIGARADVVLSVNWYWPPAYRVYLARKLWRFRLIGVPLFHCEDEWPRRAAYRRMLAQCDAVIANTSFEADFTLRHGAVRAEVGGTGVDPDQFARRDGRQLRERLRLAPGPVIGFVGRQAGNKGAGTLIRAMREVWRLRPDVRLLLAGPRPPDDRELNLLLPTLTPFERERMVTIADFAEHEKASIFDAMDVFVLPSTSESFGIAYLEAWMCRKPVIGARIGPTQCVIEDGVDGLLVAPKDADDTARAILELLRDPQRRERMGRQGYAKTLSRFTWDKVTDTVERLLLAVAGPAGLARGAGARAMEAA